MSEKARIVKHTGILMVMELGTRMLDIIISMLVARYLGPVSFGLLAFAVSFGSLFSIIPGFGMGALVTRDISRDREKISTYLIHGTAAKVILGAAMMVLMVIVSHVLWHSPEKTTLALTAGVLVIFESQLKFTAAFFQGLQMMKWVAGLNLVVRAGWVIGSLTVMALGGGVLHLIAVRCLMNLIGFTVGTILVTTRLQKIRWHWDAKLVFEMIRSSFPFALFRLFGVVYTDVDTVMLSNLRGDLMTGWYAAAQRFYKVLTFIPGSFAQTMLPLLSSYSEQSRERFTSSLKMACKFLMMIAFPIMAVGLLESREIMNFFYGKAFVESSHTLSILMMALPFCFLNEVLISGVASLNHEKKGSNILIIGLLSHVTLNSIMIPLFGHKGAAITTSVVEALVFTLQVRVIRKKVPGFSLRSEFTRPLMAAAVMGFSLMVTRGAGLLLSLVIAAPVYLLALFVLGVITLQDIRAIHAAISRKMGKKKKSLPGEKVNVLFLETSMRIGGTETVVNQLVRRFDSRRFKPVLVCFYEPGQLGEKLIHEGYTVYHGIAKKSWDLSAGFKLWKIMKKEKIHVVFIVNQPLTQFWGVICSLLAGVPGRITAIRSTGKINRIRRRLLLNRVTFPMVERVTALSQMHKDYLVKEEGISADQIEIIPNGVDMSRFELNGKIEKVRQELGLTNGSPVAGIVAMLRPEKNHEMFLRSAARVTREINDAVFLIVGDGVERPKLEALTKELGIEKNVRFLGARNDVPSVVSLFDVAVLSSHPVVETLSNAVLEYMAAAKPVVATSVGSVPEQIEDGKTGYLVDSGDHETMAARILLLLKDRNFAREMGAAALDKVKRQYTLERMVGGTENLCSRLAGVEL